MGSKLFWGWGFRSKDFKVLSSDNFHSLFDWYKMPWLSVEIRRTVLHLLCYSSWFLVMESIVRNMGPRLKFWAFRPYSLSFFLGSDIQAFRPNGLGQTFAYNDFVYSSNPDYWFWLWVSWGDALVDNLEVF